MARSSNGRSKKACKSKVKHPTEAGAITHAVQLCIDRAQPPETWKAYDCPWCGYWHVGRPPRKPLYWAEPRDMTLYDAIGSRAYWAGIAESNRRERYMARLLEKAFWRQYNLKRWKKEKLP